MRIAGLEVLLVMPETASTYLPAHPWSHMVWSHRAGRGIVCFVFQFCPLLTNLGQRFNLSWSQFTNVLIGMVTACLLLRLQFPKVGYLPLAVPDL